MVIRSFSKLASNPELYSKIESSFFKLYESTPCMPIMLRFAWHDAGTYSKENNTGGPNGSIRFQSELSHDANKGLPFSLEKIEEKKKEFPEVSYADLIQIGGYAAVSFCKGPSMDFQFGRKDANENEVTPDDRLPDAHLGAHHLRDIFYRMGMNDVEIVALSGGHTLGRAHKDRSGFEGPWTEDPYHFDNAYFKELIWNGNPRLLRMPTDNCLMVDPVFKYWVEYFASDIKLFSQEYKKAHEKLSELGFNEISRMGWKIVDLGADWDNFIRVCSAN